MGHPNGLSDIAPAPGVGFAGADEPLLRMAYAIKIGIARAEANGCQIGSFEALLMSRIRRQGRGAGTSAAALLVVACRYRMPHFDARGAASVFDRSSARLSEVQRSLQLAVCLGAFL